MDQSKANILIIVICCQFVLNVYSKIAIASVLKQQQNSFLIQNPISLKRKQNGSSSNVRMNKLKRGPNSSLDYWKDKNSKEQYSKVKNHSFLKKLNIYYQPHDLIADQNESKTPTSELQYKQNTPLQYLMRLQKRTKSNNEGRSLPKKMQIVEKMQEQTNSDKLVQQTKEDNKEIVRRKTKRKLTMDIVKQKFKKFKKSKDKSNNSEINILNQRKKNQNQQKINKYCGQKNKDYFVNSQYSNEVTNTFLNEIDSKRIQIKKKIRGYKIHQHLKQSQIEQLAMLKQQYIQKLYEYSNFIASQGDRIFALYNKYKINKNDCKDQQKYLKRLYDLQKKQHYIKGKRERLPALKANTISIYHLYEDNEKPKLFLLQKLRLVNKDAKNTLHLTNFECLQAAFLLTNLQLVTPWSKNQVYVLHIRDMMQNNCQVYKIPSASKQNEIINGVRLFLAQQQHQKHGQFCERLIMLYQKYNKVLEISIQPFLLLKTMYKNKCEFQTIQCKIRQSKTSLSASAFNKPFKPVAMTQQQAHQQKLQFFLMQGCLYYYNVICLKCSTVKLKYSIKYMTMISIQTEIDLFQKLNKMSRFYQQEQSKIVKQVNGSKLSNKEKQYYLDKFVKKQQNSFKKNTYL